MKPEVLIKAIMDDSNISMYAASLAMGKSKLYVGEAVHSKRIPTIRTVAEICSVTGHELIVRNKETGREIVIDPPERSDDGDSGAASGA